MKTYTVYFSEPVCHKYIGDRFNRELKKMGVRCRVRGMERYIHIPLFETCKGSNQSQSR